jgi:hypothetical protein
MVTVHKASVSGDMDKQAVPLFKATVRQINRTVDPNAQG